MKRKTIVYTVLVVDEIDPEDLARRLIGETPGMFPGVLGVALLDDDGTPEPFVVTRDGVEWDGWPVDGQ